MKTAKIIIIGESGVGKTSIARRYFNRNFETGTDPTVGSGYFRGKTKINDAEIELEVWDTAGAERFRSLTPIYFTNASACVLVYDITDRLSFNELDSFYKLLERAPQDVLVFLVGNKVDLDSDRKILYLEAKQYAAKIKAEQYLETSALSGEGISMLFHAIASHPNLKYLGNQASLLDDSVEEISPGAINPCC
ncbi:Vacuolar protein sorting-associated protein 21 [Tritrichomonas foetus]|uniref:Vacuolar protein sorting-associated protein 21 n=1 Tax=Tritrichomonas foetus TaxID=1144522 RepID=A0A1J4K5H3_9EUKA|nr:Vacuolar protein sorting-associated protein 21 [Tritrichomonas foetus]|eukprot:OHT04918.1 Vacuolar protein sorting-associated protein 21 [Tritrichomonas foetus]